MRSFYKLLLLFTLTAPLLSQVPSPQLNLSGNIGCIGFPCLNSGTVQLTSDANLTLTGASVTTSAISLKVTSSVALTATRSIIYPAGRFFVNVENATTGGQSILIIGPSGTGVTIANGTTASVWNDGTNFVQIGVAGGSGPTLQTNGTANVTQSVLNIANGSTIGFKNLSGGTVTGDPIVSVLNYGGLNAGTGDNSSAVTAACSANGEVYFPVGTYNFAANYTIPCPESFAVGAELLAPNGVTITLNPAISAYDYQHIFTWSGTGAYAGLSGSVPVEWFGAVGFSVLSSATTDYTANFTETLNAITGGPGWAQIKGLCYNVSSGISITKSGIGIEGVTSAETIPSFSLAPNCYATLVSTATSGTIINVTGGSPYILWNVFKYFNILRTGQCTSTTPTACIGVSMTNVGYATVQGINSNGSLDGWYFSFAPNGGLGSFRDFGCINGQSDANAYASGQTINCLDIDTTTSAMDSTYFENGAFSPEGTAIGTGVISRGIYIHGPHINDINFYDFGTAAASYSLYINYTGTGSFDTDTDEHFHNLTFDQCFVSCVYITGVSTTGPPGIYIDHGYFDSGSPNDVKIIDIEGSSGVSLTDNEILDTATGDTLIYANGSSDLLFSSNSLESGASAGIILNNTTSTVVVANKINGAPSPGATMGIALTGSTQNTIVGNNVSGTTTTGYSFDSGSLTNDVVANTCAGSFTTCMSGTPTGTAPSFLASGSTVGGVPIATSTGGVGGVSTSANFVLGTGAGTGATVTAVYGYDGTHVVAITTGTSPTAGGPFYTYTFTTPRSRYSFCTFTPGNPAAALLYGTSQLQFSSSFTTSPAANIYTLSAGSVAPPASTALVIYANCN